MSSPAVKLSSILAVVSLLASGCGIPATQQASGFRMPGGVAPPTRTPAATAMPGPAAHSPLPGYPAQAAQGPAADYAPDTQSIARVGFFSPAGSATAAGGCGCSSCGGGAVQSTHPGPYGYAMPPAAPWNAFGTDPQEFLCDGGDQLPAARLRRDDTLAGLDPEDTVVHYTTEAGDIEIQASNRTCVYAPRFASVRKITGAVAGGRAIGLRTFDRPVGTNRVEINEGGVVMSETTELARAEVARRIDAMRERNRGVPVEGILQLEQTTDVLALLVGMTSDQLSQLRDNEKSLLQEFALAAVAWTLDESLEVTIEDLKPPTLTRDQSVEAFTIYEFPDAGRLQIGKLADRGDALPGEIVTFAIRVENVGDSPVNNVVLTDNLTTRLEYVADSQTCSGGAEFEAVANDTQSLTLQWKLTDQLRVGESVTIRFQCKVR